MEEYLVKGGKRLRLGYTTGSCAAAAAKAAAWMLLTGRRKESIRLQTPKGIELNLKVLDIQMLADEARCAIQKDSGDDPDVTRGTLIFAAVRKSATPGVTIDGGEGVGRVTKPGLDQPVGEAEVFCMYLSPEEKVEWIEQSVPYEGRIPCEGAEEDMICQIRQSLEDPIVDIRQDGDGEMRALGIEATLSMKMNVYSEVETEILKDMYSLDRECVLEKKEGIYEEMLMYNQAKCKIAERLTLPELKEDVLQIIHSEGSIQAESERYTEEGVEIEGILHISFLYLRADDEQPYGSWTGMIPFSYLVEYPNLPKNVSASPAYHVEQLAVTLAGSEAVEVKAVLTFDIFLKKLISASMITNVSERQFDTDASVKRPGIVGHIVQDGEDLWSLAKKYMTTVSGIMEVNSMDNENVKTGDKLLIFKENMSIL